MVEFRVIFSGDELILGPPMGYDDIKKYVSSTDFVWIDVTKYDEKTVILFTDLLELHPVTVEDIGIDIREKLEEFERYMLYSVDEGEGNGLKIILYDGRLVVTFHVNPIKSINFVIKRLRSKAKDISYDPRWIVYGLVDEICNLYMEDVRNLMKEAQVLDHKVTLEVEEEDGLLKRMGVCRRSLIEVRTSLWAKQEILKKMIKNDSELEAYLRDVMDHVIVMLEWIGASMDIMNHISGIYLARISLEVGRHSEEMNASVNRFSAVATIFLPMSVLTSLWGMNVRVPGQLGSDQDEVYIFYLILVVLMIIGVSVGVYFRVRGWI